MLAEANPKELRRWIERVRLVIYSLPSLPPTANPVSLISLPTAILFTPVNYAKAPSTTSTMEEKYRNRESR